MRLIEADEILRELKNCRNELCLKCGEYTGEYLGNCDGCRYNRRNMAKWEELPTVDAEPVRHGRWVRLDMHKGMADHKCTSCGMEVYVPTSWGEPLYGYCPVCGAIMDEEEENAEKIL